MDHLWTAEQVALITPQQAAELTPAQLSSISSGFIPVMPAETPFRPCAGLERDALGR